MYSFILSHFKYCKYFNSLSLPSVENLIQWSRGISLKAIQ
nr:MAG TPA: hypothetical protein [Caudoviricetes sp.]